MSEHEPLQQSFVGLGSIEHSLEVDLVVDFTVHTDDQVFDDSEEDLEEFEEASDSGESDYSSSDDSG